MATRSERSAHIELSSQSPVLPRFPKYGISVTESQHVAGFAMRPSRYGFSEVMLIVGGRGEIVQGGRSFVLSERSVIFVPRETIYHLTDEKGQPMTVLSLSIDHTMPCWPILSEIIPAKFSVWSDPVFARDLAWTLRRILLEQVQGRVFEKAVVIGEVILLLARLSSAGIAPGEIGVEQADVCLQSKFRVRGYVDRLKHKFYENESLEVVAHRLGMSKRALTSYFREITGMSRGAYIQSFRIAHSKFLLGNSTQSMTSIAFACGFEDISTFNRSFLRSEKISPSAWKQKNANSFLAVSAPVHRRVA